MPIIVALLLDATKGLDDEVERILARLARASRRL